MSHVRDYAHIIVKDIQMTRSSAIGHRVINAKALAKETEDYYDGERYPI